MCIRDSALVHNDENLTELERLEISEHLSFCDECIIRYTACLEDDSLLIAPMLSSQETIIKRIKERVRRVFVNKYATMIVAASFAIIFWSCLLYTSPVLSTVKHRDIHNLAFRNTYIMQMLNNSIQNFN